MIGAIIVMHKANENIVIKFKRRLLNKTRNSSRTTQLKQTNSEQASLGTDYSALMMLNNKISYMIAPDRLICSRRWGAQ
jgi:hypothetical protein